MNEQVAVVLILFFCGRKGSATRVKDSVERLRGREVRLRIYLVSDARGIAAVQQFSERER